MKKTVKKLFSIITITALALLLTACRNEQKQKQDSLPKGDDLLPVDVETLEELREQFPDEFPLPDGTTAAKSEITALSEGGSAILDYAFIRYAEPIFITTMDEPDVYNTNTQEIRSDIPQKVESPQWIKIKAGDVLENGLRVVSAQTYVSCFINSSGGGKVVRLYTSDILTEGEITLEGIFNYSNGSEAYGYGDYYYSFYPDSTKYRVPIPYEDNNDCVSIRSYWLSNNEQLVFDGSNFYSFRFGDEILLNRNFSENAVCKAKMTFKNVVISREMSGEIIDAELEL